MKKNPYAGKYIMLEGGEGGGKTTQAPLLVEWLKSKGTPVFAVKEPDYKNVFGRLAHAIYTCGSEYEGLPGELLECVSNPRYEFVKEATAESGRHHIKHFEEIMLEVQNGKYENIPMLLQLCMIFSRLELLLTEILPRLKDGVWVVSDRGFLSTLAYGIMDGLDWRKLLEFHDYILGENFIVPNLVLLYDVSAEEGLRRTLDKQRGKKERHDTLEILERVRSAYLSLMEAPEISQGVSIVKTDGSRTVEQLLSDAESVISRSFTI